MTLTNSKFGSARVWDNFYERSGLFGEKPAIVTSRGTVSCGELYRQAEEMARSLDRAGVRENDLIALTLPNSPEFVPSFLALCRQCTRIALVSVKYQESELQAIMKNLQPRCFLTAVPLSSEILKKVPIENAVTIEGTGGNNQLHLLFTRPSVEAAPSFPDTTALIKFTSGSSGEPKGIALSSANVLIEAENVVRTLNLTPEDRILAPVPVSHSYGFDLGVLAALFSGASLYLHDTFIPRRILGNISEKKISVFLGVPSMYRFFQEIPLSSPPDLSSVRYMLSCTAPLSTGLISEFYEKFNIPICQHYGSSETGAASNHVPSEVLTRPESAGLPMNHVAIEICDESGTPFPAGIEGEVVVRSGGVALGYVMGKPSTRNTIMGDKYLTGDIGLMDKDGYLYIRGRIDGLINVGGHKVSPLEVVRILESLPGIREAAATGAMDRSGEQVVYAAVTVNRPVSEDEILEYCRSRLADYKVPRRVDIMTELPRTAAGKVKLRPGDIAW